MFKPGDLVYHKLDKFYGTIVYSELENWVRVMCHCSNVGIDHPDTWHIDAVIFPKMELYE